MRRLVLALLLLSLAPTVALAQDSEGHRGQGYLFVAPGGSTGSGQTDATLHFGGGGEYMVYRGLAFGAELGYLAPTKRFGDGFGVASVDGSYHFVDQDKPRKVVPFLTGGYTRLFRQGGANAANFGGGVNWWIRDRWGLRLEVRDHIVHAGGPTGHLWQVRFAFAFR